MEVAQKFSNPIQQALMADQLIIFEHSVPTGLKSFSSIVTWLSHGLSDVGTLTG